MYDRAAGEASVMHAEVAAWFNNGMDRVSGAYKRRSQLTCFVIAFVLAIVLNVDAVHLFSTLWKHPSLIAALSAPVAATGTTPDVSNVLAQLEVLPVGWPINVTWHFEFRQLFGWFITASSALFGAPFWFGLLQKLVNLRGAGGKTPAQETKT